MPVPTRRQAQQYRFPPPEEAEDTDSDIDVTGITRLGEDDGETIGDEQIELDEDEDAIASPDQPDADLPNLDPPPPYLREISTSASWTVSSSKPGCSIPQLRNPSMALFWQSDGPQPHYLNIHFFKLVRIAGLRLYLDFEQDESYTPTRIVFLAGSGMNDLQEWGEMKLDSPRGWVWADFSGVGDPDSDADEDEREDNGREAQRTIHPSPSTNGVLAIDAPSDSENNAPQPQITHALSDDTMQLDPQPPTPLNPFAPHTTHDPDPDEALHIPLYTPSVSISRPTPRLPFTTLTPDTRLQRLSSQSNRPPKMPILRAHLVQIKILENHQNGKDTHLRGLQIFARNDEHVGRSPVRSVGPATARITAGTGGEAMGMGMGLRRRRGQDEALEEGRFDLGSASRSAWDIEPTIR